MEIYYFPITALITEQRPGSPAASSCSSRHHFISHRPAWAGGRKRGNGFWRSIKARKKSDLIKVEQRAEKRERESVKKLLKGHSKAAKMVCGSAGGIWGRGHRQTNDLMFILNHLKTSFFILLLVYFWQFYLSLRCNIELTKTTELMSYRRIYKVFSLHIFFFGFQIKLWRQKTNIKKYILGLFKAWWNYCNRRRVTPTFDP